MFMRLLITGLFLTVLHNVVGSKQSPVTLTIEYQSENQLTADQYAFRRNVVNAAYRSLQKYVLAKQPTSRLLSEPVCRSYGKVPPPPPPTPRQPRLPNLPVAPLEPSNSPMRPSSPPSLPQHPEPPSTSPLPISPPPTSLSNPDAAAQHPPADMSRRRLMSFADDSTLSYMGSRGRFEGKSRRQRRTLRQDVGMPLPPPPTHPSNPAASGGGGGAATTITRCYPDFNIPSLDVRLQRCGLSNIMREHVRDAAAGGAVSLAGTPGEFTDLYLYISSEADPYWCPPGQDIRGSTCLYDLATGRPTMASINVCPQALDRYDANALVARLLREMIRALGVGRVGFFGLAPAEEYRSRVVAQEDSGGLATRFLATPNVKQVVRQFFACDTVPGALLDDATYDYGADDLYDSSVVLDDGEELLDPDYRDRASYIFSGWETSHFQGDILIADPDPVPAAAESPQVTALTLALLQDTTWYDVVYENAGYWTWGRGRGCEMATQHCRTLLRAAATNGAAQGRGRAGEAPLFCDPDTFASGALLCTPAGSTPGTCTAASPAFLGIGCGLVASPTPSLTVCSARETVIDVLSRADAAASRTFGWAAGYNSRCVPLRWPSAPRLTANQTQPAPISYPTSTGGGGGAAAAAGAACFPTDCDDDDKLFVQVYGTWVRCPSGEMLNLTSGGWPLAASYVSPAGSAGGLLGPCPDNAAVCATLACNPGSCSVLGGECRPAAAARAGGDGTGGGSRCFCRTMYDGESCEVNLVTGETEQLRPVALKALEVAVVLSTPLSSLYANRKSFLQLLSDEINAQVPGLYITSLSVPRLNLMSSFTSYVAAGGSPTDVQMVVRFLPVTAAEAELFQAAVAAGILEAALKGFNLSSAIRTVSYLGEAAMGIGALPHPRPTSSPSPPATAAGQPRSGAGAASGGDDGGGLSQDAKVAIGVGVSFGSLLVLLLGVLVFCVCSRAKEEARDLQDREVDLLPRSTNFQEPPPAPGARRRGDSGRGIPIVNGLAVVSENADPVVSVALQASVDGKSKGWWQKIRGKNKETKD